LANPDAMKEAMDFTAPPVVTLAPRHSPSTPQCFSMVFVKRFFLLRRRPARSWPGNVGRPWFRSVKPNAGFQADRQFPFSAPDYFRLARSTKTTLSPETAAADEYRHCPACSLAKRDRQTANRPSLGQPEGAPLSPLYLQITSACSASPRSSGPYLPPTAKTSRAEGPCRYPQPRNSGSVGFGFPMLRLIGPHNPSGSTGENYQQ